ncbi:hypothetical protein [Arthrobacter sp. Bz4]|uniref:hypothetical protein n=1 Tax=Arthrobacter sp. Bz4 TaxID=2171979 RepID=UPI000D512DDB|nr:hypothetical protein [Arthrobacter sp. Bz4]PVE15871.1 hypothetical protein DDA93_13495 [Arthrobacter sp. Bz4]
MKQLSTETTESALVSDLAREAIRVSAVRQREEIHKLSRELLAAYRVALNTEPGSYSSPDNELELSTIAVERRVFSSQLYAKKKELKKLQSRHAQTLSQLSETTGKLFALSNSLLGRTQIKYWRLRAKIATSIRKV